MRDIFFRAVAQAIVVLGIFFAHVAGFGLDGCGPMAPAAGLMAAPIRCGPPNTKLPLRKVLTRKGRWTESNAPLCRRL